MRTFATPSSLNLFILSVLFNASLLAPSAQAASEPVRPGAYTTEGGWGNAVIRRADQSGLAFDISTVVANGHMCSVSGLIKNGKAAVPDDYTKEDCLITFTQKGDALEVKHNHSDACRANCGVNGYFEGTYIRTENCSAPRRRKIRERFLVLYTDAQFDKARGQLEGLVQTCAKYLSWREHDQVLNDLALAQFRSGDAAACRRTLEPFRKSVQKTRDELQKETHLPPSDMDSLVAALQAAKTNLALCAQ